MPASRAWAILILAFGALAIVFRKAPDIWDGMTLSMAVLLLFALGVPGVIRRMTPSLFRLAFGLLAGGALYGATAAGVHLFDLGGGVETLFQWKGTHSNLWMTVTLALVIVPGEELVWRGVITRYAMERIGRAGGVLAGAALYALAHIPAGDPLLVAAAFSFGLFWGWMYAASDNLIAPIVCHFTWDVLILFVVPLA